MVTTRSSDEINELLNFYERLSIRDKRLSRILMIFLHKMDCISNDFDISDSDSSIIKDGVCTVSRFKTEPIPYVEKDNVIYINFSTNGGSTDE